ncbi:MAG: carbon storage regulator CsrA [Planctomycetes bacterium]|nr:carbon storage regulator CsrA [Planctomycetota bacterium]
MLVLSRKKNESIVIGETIVVTVVEIRGDKVRLGIEAPRDVSVHRKEIADAIAADAEGSSVNGVHPSDLNECIE